MELGARICTPRGPRCAECPIQRWCAARAGGCERDLPRRRVRPRVPLRRAVAAVVRAGRRYLVVQRPPDGLLGGLWAWPAVELSDGEAPAAALRRHLRCCFGIDARVGARLGAVTHQFSHFHLHADVYGCDSTCREAPPCADRPPRRARHFNSDALRWVTRRGLDALALAAVDRRILGLLSESRGRA